MKLKGVADINASSIPTMIQACKEFFQLISTTVIAPKLKGVIFVYCKNARNAVMPSNRNKDAEKNRRLFSKNGKKQKNNETKLDFFVHNFRTNPSTLKTCLEPVRIPSFVTTAQIQKLLSIRLSCLVPESFKIARLHFACDSYSR